MKIKSDKEPKVMKALGCGVLVWAASSAAQIALVPIDRTQVFHQIIANSIGGLVAVIVTLAIQLKHEEVHYQVAMERAAILAELNHHVRNAVFPMHIAVQSLGDADAKKIADEAVERINVALKDATADALARKVDYSFTRSAGQI